MTTFSFQRIGSDEIDGDDAFVDSCCAVFCLFLFLWWAVLVFVGMSRRILTFNNLLSRHFDGVWTLD